MSLLFHAQWLPAPRTDQQICRRGGTQALNELKQKHQDLRVQTTRVWALARWMLPLVVEKEGINKMVVNLQKRS